MALPERFWEKLTDEWLTVAEAEDLDALLRAYVHERAELFRLDEMTPPTPLPPPSDPSPEQLEVIAAMERAAERQRNERN